MGFLEPEYVQCHNYGFLGGNPKTLWVISMTSELQC
jgi:hypothetical protein